MDEQQTENNHVVIMVDNFDPRGTPVGNIAKGPFNSADAEELAATKARCVAVKVDSPTWVSALSYVPMDFVEDLDKGSNVVIEITHNSKGNPACYEAIGPVSDDDLGIVVETLRRASVRSGAGLIHVPVVVQ